MSRIGQTAPYLDGVPVVISTALRAALFPSPDTNQRVLNLETGNVERYDGSRWIADFSTGKTGPVFSAKGSGAYGDGVVNDTTTIASMFTALGGDSSGRTYRFEQGIYLVTGGGLVLTNPNSILFQGSGAGLNTVLKLASGTSPVLTFGDGTHEPFSATIRDLSLDANGNAAAPTLYFRRLNIYDVENVRVKGFGAGTGMKNDNALMFQEMYFRRFESLGDGTASGICVDIAPTGNVNFDQCNLENALTALRIRGQLYAPVTFNGGHIERAIWAIDADDAQLVLYGTTISQGQIWLGPGAHAGTIVASNHDSSIIEGGISDLGFGNKITVAGGVRTDGKAQLHPALNTDGQEWLRTPNVVDDPLFALGSSAWTATNSTITDGKAGMPGAARGRSLIVQGTSANGYAAKTFAAEASTDYLLTVAFIVTSTNNANARVQVLDESSTSLYDSGALTYTAPTGSGMKVRIHRKRIPTSAGTGKQLTVRIYSVGTTVPTIVPLLLLSKSSVNMATQITTSGTGETTSGSGTTLAISQTVNTGTFFTFNSGIKHRGPCFAYFNVTACPVGVYCGHGGDSNGASGGVNYSIDTTAREYCLFFPSFPDSGIIKFYSFAGTGTLTVSDIAVVPISLPAEPPPLLLVDGATVNLTLSDAREYLLSANGSRTLGAVPAGFDGKTFILTLNNITGGAITTTFPASYKLAGGAWTDPATLKRRSITFRIEGTTAYELHRSSGDV